MVSGVSLLGLRTGIITKLPNNDLGKFVKNRNEQVKTGYRAYNEPKQEVK